MRSIQIYIPIQYKSSSSYKKSLLPAPGALHSPITSAGPHEPELSGGPHEAHFGVGGGVVGGPALVRRQGHVEVGGGVLNRSLTGQMDHPLLALLGR